MENGNEPRQLEPGSGIRPPLRPSDLASGAEEGEDKWSLFVSTVYIRSMPPAGHISYGGYFFCHDHL